MSLVINNLYKKFGDNVIFNNFDITFQEGVISCILGPSGCGKTTLLNIIGGIVAADSGVFSGFDDKRFSYVFQEPRLLPWKTVRGNIEFVLNSKLSSAESYERADELIKRVELDGFADYYPAQLSGGMCQRVSIARAFACISDVILMDEPLSGLDAALKNTLMKWFKQIWEKDKRTVIFVTHDEAEAKFLGDERFVFSTAPVKIINSLKNSI
ncbi:MAG: ABC transporter ATP-binding protein [Bacteroidales bacterium]|jgi:NitT/TauT family transport system ATP-binding protein|nr:ABC transporter ATP-binding protein [Bacteroidales bacterium]MDD2205602.1 ABC transporter ATP-binding protein [Bacteroidales bacterium]MDD3152468.1 ABC transporter ATP-binding protein [Bacteroidales bacterium]MDD3914046.1 ABC transporter ATP-binding protein [Bacteroidales bacterium]MDD4633896.1 ABC transporter ATP-binding protein [Bacteroidales bacterium]